MKKGSTGNGNVKKPASTKGSFKAVGSLPVCVKFDGKKRKY